MSEKKYESLVNLELDGNILYRRGNVYKGGDSIIKNNPENFHLNGLWNLLILGNNNFRTTNLTYKYSSAKHLKNSLKTSRIKKVD